MKFIGQNKTCNISIGTKYSKRISITLFFSWNAIDPLNGKHSIIII